MTRLAREVKLCLGDIAPQVIWQGKDGMVGSVDLPYWLSGGFSMKPIAIVAQNSIIPLSLLEKR